MIKKNLGLIIGALLGLCLVSAIKFMEPITAHAQSIEEHGSASQGHWKFTALDVGYNNGNTTNTLTVWANDGTNFVRFLPTNAVIQWSQTNSTPASNTVVRWIGVQLQGDSSAYRIGLCR